MNFPGRIAAISVLFLVGLTLGCRGGKGSAPAQGSTSQSTTSPPNATLFYAGPSEGRLDACPAYVPPHADVQVAVAALVRRYLEGPACDGMENPFPEGTKLRAVFLLEGDVAVVDLSARARAGGGTQAEMLRVYGLVDTILFNHPRLVAVQLLVDGQEVDSLMGHLDLSKPLPPTLSLLPPGARESWKRTHGDT